MITIDGSRGEGGGQILRTSLALSMLTGKPVKFRNIRAGRAKPGLQRQHLACVRAAERVCSAKVEHAELGSQQLEFRPGPICPGVYQFTISTAGSTTLVLQTVLPALFTAGGPSTLKLEGGTHNPMAPPFEFLVETFLPLVERQGPRVTAELLRHGFAPQGGGRFEVHIEPVEQLQPLELLERGEVVRRQARALVARLPRSIAERELAVVRERLAWSPAECMIEELPAEVGPGNVLYLTLQTEHVTEICTAFGQRGTSAEAVAAEALREMEPLLKSQAPVGEHLADQLLLPMALSRGGTFVCTPLSMHSQTNMDVIREFLDVRFRIEELEGNRVRVECRG